MRDKTSDCLCNREGTGKEISCENHTAKRALALSQQEQTVGGNGPEMGTEG